MWVDIRPDLPESTGAAAEEPDLIGKDDLEVRGKSERGSRAVG